MDTFKKFWTDLFTALNTEDSIAILVFLGVSFLLGLLFGAWSRAGKIRRLKREIEAKDTELKTLKNQYDSLVEQFEKKEAELSNSETRYNEMSADINRLTNERMHYQTELRSAKEQLERLQEENLAYAARLEGTNIDAGITEVLPAVSTESTGISSSPDEVAAEVYDDRLSMIEEKLERLVLENANLKEEVSTLERNAMMSNNNSGNAGTVIAGTTGAVIGGAVAAGGSSSTVTNVETGEAVLDLSDTTVEEAPPTYEMEVLEEDAGDMSPQERAERAKSRIGSLLGTKIPKASLGEKDDLKKLEGIGPFIEMKLNDVGIYTYEQVSMLDDELADLLTDAIQFFPGRIQKDDWMGQAASLMG